MSMIIPSFLFFSIYCIVNVYLPVFFRNMGFSSTAIGLLLSILEVSGIVFTFIISKFPEKSGKYGRWLLIFSVSLALLPFPLLLSPLPVMLVALMLYAIPTKATVPISDTFINLRLGKKSERYGMVRAFGSLGFVVMSLIMQRFVDSDTITLFNSALWMAVPGILLCISFICIPRLLKPLLSPHSDEQIHIEQYTNNPALKKTFFTQFSPTYWLIIIVLTFGNIGMFGPFRFFSLYVKEYLHSDSFSLLWAISVACEIPALFFSYKFIRRFGSKNLILFCVAMISVRSFTYVLFPSVEGAAFAQVLHFFTFGLLHPATVIFIADETRGKKNAVMAQAISSVGSAGLASVIGSFVGGIIIDYYGYAHLYTISGIFPLAGLLLYFITHKKLQNIS